MTIVNRYIGVSGGYLGDLSYRTHYEFYRVYCELPHIDPNSDEYSGTTRNRFIQILESRPATEQAAIVRGVIERFGAGDANDPDRERLRASMLEWAGPPRRRVPGAVRDSVSDAGRGGSSAR